MRLTKRNNGEWVVTCKHVATGQECEAPFEVWEKGGKFTLLGYSDDEGEVMTVIATGLSKKGVLDWAEVRLPHGLTA